MLEEGHLEGLAGVGLFPFAAAGAVLCVIEGSGAGGPTCMLGVVRWGFFRRRIESGPSGDRVHTDGKGGSDRSNTDDDRLVHMLAKLKTFVVKVEVEARRWLFEVEEESRRGPYAHSFCPLK